MINYNWDPIYKQLTDGGESFQDRMQISVNLRGICKTITCSASKECNQLIIEYSHNLPPVRVTVINFELGAENISSVRYMVIL